MLASVALVGKPIQGEVEITPGIHQVALVAGSGPTFLLPAAVVLPAALPATGEPAWLFGDVYEY